MMLLINNILIIQIKKCKYFVGQTHEILFYGYAVGVTPCVARGTKKASISENSVGVQFFEDVVEFLRCFIVVLPRVTHGVIYMKRLRRSKFHAFALNILCSQYQIRIFDYICILIFKRITKNKVFEYEDIIKKEH